MKLPATKINLFLLLLFLSSGLCISQNNKKNKTNKKILKEAQYFFDNENYESSWKFYKQVLQSDKTNELAAVNSAICAFKLNYNTDSLSPLIPALTQAKQIDAKYYLAKIKHQQHRFEDALVLLDAYMQTPYRQRIHNDEESSYLIASCISARDHISNPRKATIKHMEATINSGFPDYVPVIMPDESAFSFRSKI